jgi:hypothetical protein
MNAIPAVKPLSPNHERYMREKGWIDRRIVRTKTHAKDCPHVHTVSAYVCGCNVIERKP